MPVNTKVVESLDAVSRLSEAPVGVGIRLWSARKSAGRQSSEFCVCKGESDSGVEPKELAAACLRGEATTWPAGAGSHEIADFLKITGGHGIQPLLAHRLQLHQAKAVSGWPLEIHDRLTQAARRGARRARPPS